MKRAFTNLVALSSILAQAEVAKALPGTDAPTPKQLKQRFVEGDRFYDRLQYKRVNGKIRVRGSRREAGGEHIDVADHTPRDKRSLKGKGPRTNLKKK